MSLDQQDKQWILDQLKATQGHTVDLVTGMKESLEREIVSVKESLEREMREGFERI
jgi:hypothetical protein